MYLRTVKLYRGEVIICVHVHVCTLGELNMVCIILEVK